MKHKKSTGSVNIEKLKTVPTGTVFSFSTYRFIFKTIVKKKKKAVLSHFS
jgi:hypothetical protein